MRLFKDLDTKLARQTACEMFEDVREFAYYTPYVATVTDKVFNIEGNLFYPDANVTVADFLYSLSKLFDSDKKKSIDGVSISEDYFNQGYNFCLSGYSSYFYKLYTRKELNTPITRVEVGYILVMCTNLFRDKFGSIFDGKYSVGYTFDWLHSKSVTEKFKDASNYKVSTVSDNNKVIIYNLKDYIDSDMTSLRGDMTCGLSPIPLPMFASLEELGQLDLFHFQDSNLEPLSELSRGELCYLLYNLDKEFNS